MSSDGVSQRPVLWVEVTPGPTQLMPDATRAAIANELGVEVTSSKDRQHFGHVSVIGIPGPRVIVRYESYDGASKLERQMLLPIEPKRRNLVVSWVVCNLVRNEAAEILLDMAARDFSSQPRSAPAVAEPAATDGLAPVSIAPASASSSNVTLSTAAIPSPLGPQKTTMRPPNGGAASADPAIRNEKSSWRPLGAPRIVNLALFAPSLALHADAKEHPYHLSLGGAYSRVGAIDGFGITWFVDRVEERLDGVDLVGIWLSSGPTRGVAIAGVGSASSGDLLGAEMAGIWLSRTGCVQGVQLGGVWASAAVACRSSERARNYRRDALIGVQVGGVATYVGEGFQGVQLSGLFSMGRGRGQGLQLTGGLAIAGENFSGVQVAAIGDIGKGRLYGAQLSGAFNIQGGNVEGVQVTGGYNQAGELSGLQLGLVNRARYARGLQLGIVNLANEQSGFAIGLVNWSKFSRLQPIYFLQTPGFHNVGYRILSGYASSTISFGYDSARERARTHFGFGAHGCIDRFGLGVEVGYGWVLERMSDGPRDRAHELDLIGRASAELLRGWISVFAGGGLSLPVAGRVPIEPAGLAQVGISLL
ncbi:MAG TPA: hypothetical protein VIV60_23255 [Polyangiaceae bacterium]